MEDIREEMDKDGRECIVETYNNDNRREWTVTRIAGRYTMSSGWLDAIDIDAYRDNSAIDYMNALVVLSMVLSPSSLLQIALTNKRKTIRLCNKKCVYHGHRGMFVLVIPHPSTYIIYRISKYDPFVITDSRRVRLPSIIINNIGRGMRKNFDIEVMEDPLPLYNGRMSRYFDIEILLCIEGIIG